MTPRVQFGSIGQLGRAAKRSWLDLAYSMILANPKIEQDDIELFHVDHGNLGSAVLSDTAIGAACAAIRRQVVIASEGPEGQQIQHGNIRPRYLIVTPELETTARKALRLMKLDDPEIDLELRMKSRLTDIGVRNPLTKETIKGTPTNWMVSASKDIAPWLLCGILSGQAQPRIRASEFNPANNAGRYGLAVDISWAVACKLADYRGVYFSTGTGA